MRTELQPSFLRTLWVNAVFAPKTSLGFMRVDFVLGTIFIIPLTQIIFFGFVATLAGDSASGIGFVVVGNAVATITYSSVFSVCQTTDNEKQAGTIEHLLVSPANRIALYFGRGLLPIGVSLATVTVGLVYAVVLYHVPFSVGASLGLAVSIVLTAFAMVGFGLLLAGVALFLRTSIILGNIFLFIGLLLSGVNFPVSNLPAGLGWLGELLPLTWGLAAIRAGLSGEPIGIVAPLWGLVALCAAASFGIAILLWATFERRAMSTGSIARF